MPGILSIPMLKDVRFWIIFFFLIRLTGITNAPLEKAHNWRQVTTNMYARNFLEIDNNPLYCRVDMAGELSGITAKEFPAFNYLIYLFARVFGWQHWYGRLINLIISSLGVYFFYKTLRLFFTKQLATTAAVLLTTSAWFMYSRKIIPDTFSTSFAIAGIYFGFMYLYKKPVFHNLLLYFICTLTGTLSKLPSMALFVVFLVPFFQKDIKFYRKLYFSSFSALVLLCNVFWYGFWIPYIIDTYGFTHHPIYPFKTGVNEIIMNLPQALERLFLSSVKSFVYTACIVAGVWFMFKQTRIWLPFILVLASFSIVILELGKVFLIHEYYAVTMLPVLALVAANFLQKIPTKWLITIMVLIASETIANQWHDFKIPKDEQYKLQLDDIADKYIPSNALIVINGGHNPQSLYFTHRKGWTITNTQLHNFMELQSRVNKGAEYLIVLKHEYQKNQLFEKEVFSNDFIKIFKFKSPV